MNHQEKIIHQETRIHQETVNHQEIRIHQETVNHQETIHYDTNRKTQSLITQETRSHKLLELREFARLRVPPSLQHTGYSYSLYDASSLWVAGSSSVSIGVIASVLICSC